MGANQKQKVSIVMSVYNGAEYVRDAIDSILDQTYENFEFIIVDDGSTDKTASILKSYNDERIKVFSQSNKGLVSSLNRGIKLSKGTYIARQDADDRSESTRLKQQLTFLQANPHVVIVGSSMNVMNTKGKVTHKHHVLLNDPELRQELLIRSPFAHGSVMFTREAFETSEGYKQEYWPAEDYELWLQLSAKGQLANLDECLYIYRENEKGISASNGQKQAEAVSMVTAKAWQERSRLVGRRGITLGSYKKLPDFDQRVKRIIANVRTAARQATQRKDYSFAIKNLSLLSRSPLAYRRTAGTIKRKLASKKEL